MVEVLDSRCPLDFVKPPQITTTSSSPTARLGVEERNIWYVRMRKERLSDASESAASRVFFVLSKIGCPTTPLVDRPPGLSMKFANDDTNASHKSKEVGKRFMEHQF